MHNGETPVMSTRNLYYLSKSGIKYKSLQIPVLSVFDVCV